MTTNIKLNKNLDLLNVSEVADLLNLSKQKILVMIKSGELPGYKLNSRVFRVSKTDLELYIESKRYQVSTL